MAGRPSTFDTQKALEKAMLLFWENGYNATGISSLEKHLGLGRQSIYNTFGDKSALFLKAYQHYLDTRLNTALALLQEEDSPQAALRNLFQSSLDCSLDKHHGCFIGNTLASPPITQSEVEQLTDKALQIFITALRETLAPLFRDQKDQCELTAATWNFLTLFQGTQLLFKQKSTHPHLLDAVEYHIKQLPSE